MKKEKETAIKGVFFENGPSGDEMLDAIESFIMPQVKLINAFLTIRNERSGKAEDHLNLIHNTICGVVEIWDKISGEAIGHDIKSRLEGGRNHG